MDALESGRGLERLRAMITAQGGDPACCDDVTRLPQAPVVQDVPAASSGYVHCMDTVALGNAAQAKMCIRDRLSALAILSRRAC